MKQCTKCLIAREVSDFAVSTRGYTCSHCRFCKAAATRSWTRKYKYGIDDAVVAEMSDKQAGLCALCKTAKWAHVDHDHATGRIRGLLCAGCNTGLGKLGDTAAGLYQALAYLEGFQPFTFVA